MFWFLYPTTDEIEMILKAFENPKIKTNQHMKHEFHNPDNLTPEQVGPPPWRLFLKSEVATGTFCKKTIEGWGGNGKRWINGGSWIGTNYRWTYRTQDPLPNEIISETPEPDYDSKEHKIATFTAWLDGKQIEYRQNGVDWSIINSPSWALLTCHYRVKPTPEPPKRVPLEAKDVPPGSAVSSSKGRTWHMVLHAGINRVIISSEASYNYYDLMDVIWEIKRPGQDWMPCYKEEVK